ncbi:MAG: hypothetical protein U5R06_10685 [candidate division KSB1 bacterium]|nr:hypothetical protein [candidate division KSB1 bacterium]
MEEQANLFQEQEDREMHTNLAQLFRQSFALQSSKEYFDMLNFISRFKNYSAYNNMLVYMQNPNVTFYATARDWYRKFGRTIKRYARPMVILAPMSYIIYFCSYFAGCRAWRFTCPTI